MFFNILGEDTRTLITFALLLLPASLYIMALMKGRKGHYFFLSALAVHLVSMALRGLETGNIPLTEKHDTISFMAFSTALAYWYATGRKEMKNLDLLALSLVAALIFVSFLHMPINTVSPFMETPAFYLHTFFYFLSYGFFGIAACIGVLYMLEGNDELEGIQYRVMMHGWLFLSLSLVAGSVWFFVAHGTYWLWTSKELWTALMWFYYSLYLHARLIRGLRGRPAALLGSVGFAVALFTYFGVGTIIPSPPTQF